LNSSKQIFLAACSDHNLAISEFQLQLIEKYITLLLSHNKNLNLISRKDEENIWTNHILHCTSLLFHRKFPSYISVLDLGTGGGLPGIVFAILHPEIRFTLLDAIRKKIDAVQSMADVLGLTNVKTVWGRAEDVGKQPDYAGKFHIVVARAVAPLNKLVKWAQPFLRSKSGDAEAAPGTIPGCSLVAFKGGNIDEELKWVGKSKAVQKFESLLLDRSDDKKVIIVQLFFNCCLITGEKRK